MKNPQASVPLTEDQLIDTEQQKPLTGMSETLVKKVIESLDVLGPDDKQSSI